VHKEDGSHISKLSNNILRYAELKNCNLNTKSNMIKSINVKTNNNLKI